MNPLLAIVGPTAAGKTDLSIRLAAEFDGEIINADSRQAYRYMDIGTAKPTKEERALISHHLFDIVDPDEGFSLALYQELARDAIDQVHRRNRVPILVGGSGQYIWAVLEGWGVPEVPPDDEIRKELEKRVEEEGNEALFRELKELDPEAAEQIDPRNVRRVIRALEVCRITGKRFSELRIKTPPSYDIRILGVAIEREALFGRIDERVDRMIEMGFVEEVKGLLERGYSSELPSMSSLGYREIGRYLNGEMSLEEAAQQIKYATHRFARHQYSWFKPNDARITWIDPQNMSRVTFH